MVEQLQQASSARQSNHVVRASTVGLWQFNKTLVDESENENPFVRERGAGDAYVEGLIPGVKGLKFDGGKEYRVEGDAVYALAGDMTVAFMARASSTGGLFVTYRGSDDFNTEPHNPFWGMDMWGTARKLRWIQKYGAGVSQTHEVTAYDFPMYDWVHVVGRRDEGIVQFFIDGVPFGDPSSALTAPTGGGSAWLQVGSWENGGADYTGELQSLVIESAALSNKDIRDMARGFKPYLPAGV